MAIYYLSMFLLLKTEAVRSLLSADEVEEVTTMAPYIALHYLPWMLSSKYGARWVQMIELNFFPMSIV